MILRSALLRRTLLLVISALVLSTLLAVTVYQVISPRVFAARRTDEMLPKARFIASLVEHQERGNMSVLMLQTLLRNNSAQWDAYVWVVNSRGRAVLTVQNGGKAFALPNSIDRVLARVLSGQEATHIGRLPASNANENRAAPFRQSQNSLNNFDTSPLGPRIRHAPELAFPEEVDLVLAGVPIRHNEHVIGAVFMAQTMTEVITGMRSLSNTLLYTLLGAMLLMLPLAYIVSSRLSKPIKQMRDVALSMASGDFTVRANTDTRGEIGELGGALNFLSAELGRNVAELMVERTRLRRILNGLTEGILAVDAQGTVTHVNPAMGTLFSSPAEEIEEIWTAYNGVLTGKGGATFVVRTGNTAVQASLAALEDEEGRVAGAVGVFRDVTREERLEQTRRDYVANVSHELRTPLTALRAFVEPLRDGLVTDEADRNRLYGVMLRETLRLTRLVSDMLELSRLQSGVLSLEKYPFDPLHMLRDVYEKFQAHAEDHGQPLFLQLPEEAPQVYGNWDRTEQVLVSLLDNAIKYTPEGGRIELSADPQPDALYISVRDSGMGIDEADLPHVFDRFYKADKAHQGNGTGLGLAITREILLLLGEEITVTSQPGEGSCFTFTLHWVGENAQ
ncbi:MAG: cell wall metabolism sensor histidine kinase WalK [Clostridia bacterium]|nr:cell wall metabolism sensor histidine kinase WalK [Clostridia bacterium]